jgi:hypothetical protein
VKSSRFASFFILLGTIFIPACSKAQTFPETQGESGEQIRKLKEKCVALRKQIGPRIDNYFRLDAEVVILLKECESQFGKIPSSQRIEKLAESIADIEGLLAFRYQPGDGKPAWGAARRDTRTLARLLEEFSLWTTASQVYRKVEEQPLKSGEMLERAGELEAALANYRRVLERIPVLKEQKASYRGNYPRDPWYARADLQALEAETKNRIDRLEAIVAAQAGGTP